MEIKGDCGSKIEINDKMFGDINLAFFEILQYYYIIITKEIM